MNTSIRLNETQAGIIELAESCIAQFKHRDKEDSLKRWKEQFELCINRMTQAGIPFDHPVLSEAFGFWNDIISPMFEADMKEDEQMRLRETVGDFRNCNYLF